MRKNNLIYTKITLQITMICKLRRFAKLRKNSLTYTKNILHALK